MWIVRTMPPTTMPQKKSASPVSHKRRRDMYSRNSERRELKVNWRDIIRWGRLIDWWIIEKMVCSPEEGRMEQDSKGKGAWTKSSKEAPKSHLKRYPRTHESELMKEWQAWIVEGLMIEEERSLNMRKGENPPNWDGRKVARARTTTITRTAAMTSILG